MLYTQPLFLSPSYLYEKVDVNQKGLNQNYIRIRNKGLA